MSLNDIVNVVITRESSGVSRAGFGTICIVGPNASFGGRLQYYTDLESLAADLSGGVTDEEYLAASAVFSQNPKVTRVAIGRIDSGDASLTASLNAIQAEQPDWYGLIIASRVLADQEEAADWAETQTKIAGFASADSDIIDVVEGSDTSSIAYYLKANSLARSFAVYSAVAATKYADAALLGKILPFDPGSYTAKFKTLAGITVDVLTPTQSGNATDKNCNVYEEIGGVNIFREGIVGEGEFIDTIVFIDWLKARIQESVYSSFTRALKVPFTTAGIGTMGQALDSPLKVGQNRGGISPKEFDSDGNQIGGYSISLPALADAPAVDKAARFLDNVRFTAWLAGAIHATKINGVVIS